MARRFHRSAADRCPSVRTVTVMAAMTVTAVTAVALAKAWPI